jgi:transcription termination factor Rho
VAEEPQAIDLADETRSGVLEAMEADGEAKQDENKSGCEAMREEKGVEGKESDMQKRTAEEGEDSKEEHDNATEKPQDVVLADDRCSGVVDREEKKDGEKKDREKEEGDGGKMTSMGEEKVEDEAGGKMTSMGEEKKDGEEEEEEEEKAEVVSGHDVEEKEGEEEEEGGGARGGGNKWRGGGGGNRERQRGQERRRQRYGQPQDPWHLCRPGPPDGSQETQVLSCLQGQL